MNNIAIDYLAYLVTILDFITDEKEILRIKIVIDEMIGYVPKKYKRDFTNYNRRNHYKI